jgi:hypothetical protein
MLTVETIVKVRSAYSVDDQPIKAIYRQSGVLRKVIRKCVVRSGPTEFRSAEATTTWRVVAGPIG